MSFHAKEPLLAFAGLVHLRIPFARFVLRRAGSINEGSIDQRSVPEPQPLFLQVGVDLGKDRFGQLMRFESMPKLKHRAFIQDAPSAQRELGEATHRGDLVERIFCPWITEVVPLLKAVNSQHRR